MAKPQLNKICKICKIEKDYSEYRFYKGYYSNICKVCDSKKSAENQKNKKLENIKDVIESKNYSFVRKVNRTITIKCKFHGNFSITSNSLKNNFECPLCKKERKRNNFFTNKIKECGLENKFDYSSVKYINSKTKIKVKCYKHGVFYIEPRLLFNGTGCKKCYIDRIKSKDFESKAKVIHNNKYKYFNDYINSRTKVKVECPEHGIFETLPFNHLNGVGCPRCNISKNEELISNILDQNGIKFERQKKFKGCKNKRLLPFDFYLPKYNICIEYDGIHHFKEIYSHEDLKYRQKNDSIKDNYCLENNIIIYRISYTENTNKKIQEICQNLN